jgi:hypothetical protein
MMSWIDSRHWKISTLSSHISNFDDIGQCWIFAVLRWPFWKWWPVEIVQCRESIILRIESRHSRISTGHHFQNGHHNTAKIQHCPISSIGQCWIFVVLWWPFWKWRPVEIVQCRESIRDIIIYPHVKWRTIPQKFNIVRYHQNLISG